MTMKERVPVWITVSFFCAVALTAAHGAEADFKNKTMRIIGGFGPGGSIDLRSRVFARHLGRFLPGKPNIIVQSMPGAGGVVAANYVYAVAKPNGLTIIHFPSSTVMNTFLRTGRVQYDIRKMPILWVQPDSWITVSDPAASGIKSVQDLASRSKPVAIGGSGITSLRSLRPKIAMELLGAKNKLVTGYAGTGGLMAAIDRSEIDVFEIPLASYERYIVPRQKEGTAAVLFQTGFLQADGTFKRSELVPEVPTLAELLPLDKKKGPVFDAWRAATAPQSFQSSVATSPNVPAATLAALRQAFAKMNEDPAYKADFEKVLNQPATSVVGDEAEKVVQIGLTQLFEEYSDGVEYLKELPKRN